MRIRLDRALANNAWRLLFHGATVHHISMSTSDHSMLSLLLKDDHHGRRKDKKLFRFKEMWLSDPHCSEVVQESWQEGLSKPDGLPIINCLETCRARLQTWNKTEYGHVGRKIQYLHKKLQMLENQAHSVETDREIYEVRNMLNTWLDAENTMWKQQSRNFWLTDGDRNTSFFHTKAINRKQRNTIHGICDSDGNW